MRIIEPSFELEYPFEQPETLTQDVQRIVRHLEKSARTCYKSEHKICEGTAGPFVRKMTQIRKHVSTIEHAGFSVRFIVDRGVSHELVRHRLAAFSQESTRYCNYVDENFGSELTVIKPLFYVEGTPKWNAWFKAMQNAEASYFELIGLESKPEEARDVLPNSQKTEVVMTCNFREWRHVFTMRVDPKAHPQMRQVMRPLLDRFKQLVPELFDDICYPESSNSSVASSQGSAPS